MDADGLALGLAARSRRKLAAEHKDHQGDGQLGHGVGVLAGGVHHHDAPCGSGGQVHVVVTGTGAYDDFEFRGGGDDLGGHLIGTDDEGVHIGHGGNQVFLGGIFFKQSDLVATAFEDVLNAVHRINGERLLGSDQDFHFFRDSNSFMQSVRAWTSSRVQAL